MNIETKITPRLKMVADLVPKCETAADIGTDHGYLPIYLVKHGICKNAIAADVNPGPLNSAMKNIALVRCRNSITTILSDGLENIDKADTVTIAGMGGELIAKILSKRKKGMTQFVLQPQRSYDFLRYYLAKNGFLIEKEALAKEGDKMYCAFFARFTGEKHSITQKEALIGKTELLKENPLYAQYLKYRKRQIELALESVKKNSGDKDRQDELEKILKIYREAENEIRANN